MSSTSSDPSIWQRLASLCCAAVLVAGAAAAQPTGNQRSELDEAWFSVSQALDTLQEPALRDRTEDLLRVADRHELRRLTPYALAFVVRSRAVPPADRVTLLQLAARLDPESAEVALAGAQNGFLLGHPLAGIRDTIRGISRLIGDGRTRRSVGATILLGIIPVLGVAFAIWALVAIRRVFPRAWHDMVETGLTLKLDRGAPLLAVVGLFLPIFTAGDPVWLGLWVFALCWAYLPGSQKLFGLAGFALIAVTPWLIEIGFRAITHPENPILSSARALDEGRLAPAATDALPGLADLFSTEPGYYRLLGDAYRQAGRLESATWAYREGLRLDGDNGGLWLDLGTVEYLQADYNAAVQAFERARTAGVDRVIASYDLSLTLAQTYHFRESEAALDDARRADPERLRALTLEKDQQQLLMSHFTLADARGLLAKKDPIDLINRAVLPPPLERERTFLHPMAIAAVVCMFVALLYSVVRERTGGLASACIKCGRPFCRRCKLSRESQSYCSQCVNIFLRKDMVAIDVQVSKRNQVARRTQRQKLERRILDTVLPGLGIGFSGRPWLGWTLGLATTLAAAIALVWLPHYLAPVLLNVSLVPLEVVAALVWLAALTTAHLLPAGKG